MTSGIHRSLAAFAREVCIEDGLLNIAESYQAISNRDDLEWLGIPRSSGWRESKYRSME